MRADGSIEKDCITGNSLQKQKKLSRTRAWWDRSTDIVREMREITVESMGSKVRDQRDVDFTGGGVVGNSQLDGTRLHIH